MKNSGIYQEVLLNLLKEGEWNKAEEFCFCRLNEEPHDSLAYIGLLLIEKRLAGFEDLKTINNLKGNKYFKNALLYADDELKQKLLLAANISEGIEKKTQTSDNAKIKRTTVAKKSEKNKNILMVVIAVLVIFLQLLYFYDYRSSETLYQLGRKSFYGIGRPVNKLDAVRYFEKAARRGHVGAKVSLGLIYYLGNGVDSNPKAAEYYLKQAADSGNSSAQYVLGSMYIERYGVEKDLKKGMDYCKLAVERGNYDVVDEIVKTAPLTTASKTSKNKDPRFHDTGLLPAIRSAEGIYINTLIRRGMTDELIKAYMIKCPAGTFEMGSPSDELGRGKNETQHKVTISKDFYIAKYPVTQKIFHTVVGENHSFNIINWGDTPAENMSWQDAKEFCERLNKLTVTTRPDGYEFDLPTEAQWEYACRAGTTSPLNNGKKSVFDDDSNNPNLDEIAWYQENCDCTHIVGLKKPNAWGIYDMIGNVNEWCRDWYGEYFPGPCIDPQGPANGTSHVARGGSFFYFDSMCRSAYRDSSDSDKGSINNGLRIVFVQRSKSN